MWSLLDVLAAFCPQHQGWEGFVGSNQLSIRSQSCIVFWLEHEAAFCPPRQGQEGSAGSNQLSFWSRSCMVWLEVVAWFVWLEHSNLGRTCLIFCSVDPTFHHKIFTADHPLHQMAYFCVVCCCCNKQIWLQKKIKWKDEVRGDVAQHVLFYHRKAPY